MLTVPLLVYGFDLHPRAATIGSLVAVGSSAVVGAIARRVQVDWAIAALLAVLGIVGSLLGTRAASAIDPHALLLAFAVMLLLAAIALLRPTAEPRWQLARCGAGIVRRPSFFPGFPGFL